MSNFRFLQKIISPAVPAEKITDFIAKYDGEFIELNQFNQLGCELSKNLKQFKNNISQYRPFDSQSRISVFNYKGGEFNCLIFSIDISERDQNILNVNAPFLTILQVGKNIYFSQFGHLNDSISLTYIKQILNIGINSNLFPEDYKVKFLTDRILESFTFKSHSPQTVYKVETIIENITNCAGAKNDSDIILAKDNHFSLNLKSKAFGFSFIKQDLRIVKKELNDGKSFVSNNCFIEVNNDHLHYNPFSIFIYRCDEERLDINYNCVEIDSVTDKFLSDWHAYCHTYVTTSERQIARLVRKNKEIMETYLNAKLQEHMASSLNIDEILEKVKEQASALQDFKVRNQTLLAEALSEYQDIEVI